MTNPINQKSISRYVKLKDYKVFDYEIPETFLDFVIKKNAVNVTTKLKLVKKKQEYQKSNSWWYGYINKENIFRWLITRRGILQTAKK